MRSDIGLSKQMQLSKGVVSPVKMSPIDSRTRDYNINLQSQRNMPINPQQLSEETPVRRLKQNLTPPKQNKSMLTQGNRSGNQAHLSSQRDIRQNNINPPQMPNQQNHPTKHQRNSFGNPNFLKPGQVVSGNNNYNNRLLQSNGPVRDNREINNQQKIVKNTPPPQVNNHLGQNRIINGDPRNLNNQSSSNNHPINTQGVSKGQFIQKNSSNGKPTPPPRLLTMPNQSNKFIQQNQKKIFNQSNQQNKFNQFNRPNQFNQSHQLNQFNQSNQFKQPNHFKPSNQHNQFKPPNQTNQSNQYKQPNQFNQYKHPNQFNQSYRNDNQSPQIMRSQRIARIQNQSKQLQDKIHYYQEYKKHLKTDKAYEQWKQSQKMSLQQNMHNSYQQNPIMLSRPEEISNSYKSKHNQQLNSSEYSQDSYGRKQTQNKDKGSQIRFMDRNGSNQQTNQSYDFNANKNNKNISKKKVQSAIQLVDDLEHVGSQVLITKKNNQNGYKDIRYGNNQQKYPNFKKGQNNKTATYNAKISENKNKIIQQSSQKKIHNQQKYEERAYRKESGESSLGPSVSQQGKIKRQKKQRKNSKHNQQKQGISNQKTQIDYQSQSEQEQQSRYENKRKSNKNSEESKTIKLKQQDIEIKKLKNQLGLAKLRENQLKSQVNKYKKQNQAQKQSIKAFKKKQKRQKQ